MKISRDLLGVVWFLCQSSDCYLLREIDEYVPASHHEEHLVLLALNRLKPSERELLFKFVRGKRLSKKEDRLLRDKGFLYYWKPTLHKEVIRACKLRMPKK